MRLIMPVASALTPTHTHARPHTHSHPPAQPTLPPSPHRDEVNLFDPSGKLTATAKWSNADMGSALHLQVCGGGK
jgi:hypothetical protein